jgi:hypothetical protein
MKNRIPNVEEFAIDDFLEALFEELGYLIQQPPLNPNEARKFLRSETLRVNSAMGWKDFELDDIRLQLRNDNFMTEQIMVLVCVVFLSCLIIVDQERVLWYMDLNNVCPESLLVDYKKLIKYEIHTKDLDVLNVDDDHTVIE